MNEITRKATNALVAMTDFFSGALASEAQAAEVQQKQLNALAEQLKNSGTMLAQRDNVIDEQRDKLFERDLKIGHLQAEIEEQRESTEHERKRLTMLLEQTNLDWVASTKEVDRLRLELLKTDKLRMAERLPQDHARALLALIDASKRLRDTPKGAVTIRVNEGAFRALCNKVTELEDIRLDV